MHVDVTDELRKIASDLNNGRLADVYYILEGLEYQHRLGVLQLVNSSVLYHYLFNSRSLYPADYVELLLSDRLISPVRGSLLTWVCLSNSLLPANLTYTSTRSDTPQPTHQYLTAEQEQRIVDSLEPLDRYRLVMSSQLPKAKRMRWAM